MGSSDIACPSGTFEWPPWAREREGNVRAQVSRRRVDLRFVIIVGDICEDTVVEPAKTFVSFVLSTASLYHAVRSRIFYTVNHLLLPMPARR